MIYRLTALLIACLLAWAVPARAATPQPVKVTLTKTAQGWQLTRAGQPYFIKGAGGSASKQILKDIGGNSFRTWGVGADTQSQLDEAQRLGLTVSLGIWLGHKEHGFNYDDPAAVQKQLDEARQTVLRYKDSPALLIWSLGNEMEMGNDTPELWNAIEAIAKMVHEVDPNHPTMTVVAEIGGDKVKHINEYCPDIDIVGINSYGGGPSVAERYVKAGGTKPIVLTEYGPPGTWETKMTSFGAAPELTSTEKAARYRATYEKSVLGAPGLCLGSYAFTWGYKIEATATWYGMFLPDGSKLAAVDTMQELWTGKPPAHPCPVMSSLQLTSSDDVKAGAVVTAEVKASDPQGDPLKIEWALYGEQATYDVQGGGADPTQHFKTTIKTNGQPTVQVTMPEAGGIYRLYCYVHNTHGGAAVGSLPIKVTAAPPAALKAPPAHLPLIIYGHGARDAYIPSGWMGNTAAITMDAASTDQPRGGGTCLKVTYNANDNWAGVAWQSPANDWGDKPGGFDLSKAKTLTFWPRGAKGGEKVKFGYGLIGKDKKFHDTASDDTTVTLTDKWQKFTLDLQGKDLSRIKSGFYWTLAGQGQPVTFYLDDVQYN